MTSKVRTADIPAWYAKKLMEAESEPEEWVLWCEVFDNGEWRRFRDYEDIDDHLDDWMDLGKLAEEIVMRNIGFMTSFRMHRVNGGFEGVDPIQIDPIFHAVMSANYATLHEIRTVYSLQDIYLMLDSLTTTRRNEKLAIAAAKAANNG